MMRNGGIEHQPCADVHCVLELRQFVLPVLQRQQLEARSRDCRKKRVAGKEKKEKKKTRQAPRNLRAVG